MKRVFIAEKPSVARAFAAALGEAFSDHDGYMESENSVVTWCVGHLVTMSYPEVYDPSLKKWSFDTLPFIPKEYRYEVIPSSKKQFLTVKKQLTRSDVDTIYVCTDSGREGEYIYRLVEKEAGVKGKTRKRVWIDSQTEAEILRGIREAKDLSEYDRLSASAYLRAKEDYLMGINFSRAVTLRYGYEIKKTLGLDRAVVAIGRVMTCVLGMVVTREREIRGFDKTPYFRVVGNIGTAGEDKKLLPAEWRSAPGSAYFESPVLYNEKGFRERAKAEELINKLGEEPVKLTVIKNEKKKEQKYAPLLYNLAELQNDCSRRFKIDPGETLAIAQELYEKKLTTYPRTDARVLSTAIAKEIRKNITGLTKLDDIGIYARSVIQHDADKNMEKTRFVNDAAITDHYAIIPTGEGLSALSGLKPLSRSVYELIARRFLAIFYPPAVYQRLSIEAVTDEDGAGKKETFFAGLKFLESPGYLHVAGIPQDTGKDAPSKKKGKNTDDAGDKESDSGADTATNDEELYRAFAAIRKNSKLDLTAVTVKEGETTPPRRYNTGSMILAMENAGQLIEDEELREQIKGSGIGTSATRAGILDKLFKNGYLALNKKTQIITPTGMGELIYEVVDISMKQMLSPRLTASWEKGLTQVETGQITEAEYMEKLTDFIVKRTKAVRDSDLRQYLTPRFSYVTAVYAAEKKKKRK